MSNLLGEVFWLNTEVDRLRAQVDELQARMTEMVENSQNRRVRAFMAMVGQDMPIGPVVPADDVVRLRLRLIAEEFFELLDASLKRSRSRPLVPGDVTDNVYLEIEYCPIKVDLPEFVDALADLDYVIEGTRVACGVLGEPVAALVHESNMAKVGGGLDAAGKAAKPAGWVAPDVASELKRQGWKL